jgi:hypothetical protein
MILELSGSLPVSFWSGDVEGHAYLPAEERWKFRSRTYQGIAEAMADQWGNLTGDHS